MSTASRLIEAARHESSIGTWEMARALPAPALRMYVREYVGWSELTTQPLLRRELPTDLIPLMVNFGSPVRIFDYENPHRWTDFGTFTTGVYDRYVLVGTSGPSGGLQINFTILGARLFLARPLGELANLTVTLHDLVGSEADRLASELYDAPSWAAQFDILDRDLASRISSARQPTAPAILACRRLVATRGQIPITRLVEEADCSQKHLIASFREEIGLTPKRLGRILRFGAAVDRIKRGDTRLATLALDCGYYDQAHFDRDFRAFAGVTPSELIRQMLPTGGGFSASDR